MSHRQFQSTCTAEAISSAAAHLVSGDLVAFPTETVYGLAGNAFSESAIHKIFELKKRPLHNPLIVHIKSENELYKYVQNIPIKAKLLAKTFWPGPLTLVLPRTNLIPDYITANNETVAIRVPNHRLTLELLSNLDYPLAAPSANPSNHVSSTTAQHVEKYFNTMHWKFVQKSNCSWLL